MLFRRSPVEAGGDDGAARDEAEAAARALRAPKGRPTPSRKEAEALRKQRAKPALDKRSAARAQRAAAATERAQRRQGLVSGDQRYLPARDQGPVRGFARDYVDSRRTVGEFMLPAMLVFVPLTLAINSVQSVTFRGYVVLATYVYLLVVVVGTAWVATRVKSEARRRFPQQDLRGIGLYAAMRSVQLRRWRIPKSRVKLGDPI